jgi:hypothetical protein
MVEAVKPVSMNVIETVTFERGSPVSEVTLPKTRPAPGCDRITVMAACGDEGTMNPFAEPDEPSALKTVITKFPSVGSSVNENRPEALVNP